MTAVDLTTDDQLVPRPAEGQAHLFNKAVERYLEAMRGGRSNASHLREMSNFNDASPLAAPGYFGDHGAELGGEDDARRVWEERGWIPAVAGPHEDERRRVLARHKLHSIGKLEGVDKVADLAADVFKVPVVVVSLVLEDRETFSEYHGFPDASELTSVALSEHHRMGQGRA